MEPAAAELIVVTAALPTNAQARTERGEVERERIVLDEREPPVRIALTQPCGEVAVDLDGRDASCAFDQRIRKRPSPGPISTNVCRLPEGRRRLDPFA